MVKSIILGIIALQLYRHYVLHAALTGSSFTLTDNVLEDGVNTVVVQATGLSGGTADVEYSVLRNTATVSHSPISEQF